MICVFVPREVCPFPGPADDSLAYAAKNTHKANTVFVLEKIAVTKGKDNSARVARQTKARRFD